MKVIAKFAANPMFAQYAYATSRVASGWGMMLQQRLETTFDANLAELRRLFGALLTPIAFTGFAFSAWRLAADLRFARDFIITNGPLSHWLVWLAIGAAVQFCANTLKRIDQPGDPAGDSYEFDRPVAK